MRPDRAGMQRRLVRLEEMTARRERRCVCGIPPEKLTLDSQSTVMAHSEGERTCPDCGRERIVVLMHPDFPLD